MWWESSGPGRQATVSTPDHTAMGGAGGGTQPPKGGKGKLGGSTHLHIKSKEGAKGDRPMASKHAKRCLVPLATRDTEIKHHSDSWNQSQRELYTLLMRMGKGAATREEGGGSSIDPTTQQLHAGVSTREQ